MKKYLLAITTFIVLNVVPLIGQDHLLGNYSVSLNGINTGSTISIQKKASQYLLNLNYADGASSQIILQALGEGLYGNDNTAYPFAILAFGNQVILQYSEHSAFDLTKTHIQSKSLSKNAFE